jgi:diaminopimelate epimerase
VFARYLITEGLAEPSADGLPIATRKGVVRARLDGAGIAVDMGLPRSYGRGTATLGGLSLTGTAVDCGNPHLVCPLPVGTDLAGLDLTRPPLVDPALFPDGVNVEFTSPGTDAPPAAGAGPAAGAAVAHVRMRVYERGSGETLSCGTGACAVAAVTLAGLGRETGAVAVDVPGGRVTVTLDGATCWLSGPAVLVATGDVDLAALPASSRGA